jgi:hypothetical protein
MPLAAHSRASIETVNAVPIGAVFSATIMRRPSCPRRSSVIGKQINPRAWRSMKLMWAGVIFSAAATMSPLVLAVLVIHEDDHAARRELRRELLDRCDQALAAVARTSDLGRVPEHEVDYSDGPQATKCSSPSWRGRESS